MERPSLAKQLKMSTLGELAGAHPNNNTKVAGNGEYGNGDHGEKKEN